MCKSEFFIGSPVNIDEKMLFLTFLNSKGEDNPVLFSIYQVMDKHMLEDVEELMQLIATIRSKKLYYREGKEIRKVRWFDWVMFYQENGVFEVKISEIVWANLREAWRAVLHAP